MRVSCSLTADAMKLDVVFALESAGWPALLVDGSNTLCRANAAAIKLFGPVLEGGSPGLPAIWSPENNVAAEQFLAAWERSPAPAVALKFRARGGMAVSALTSICAFTKEGEKYFVLQLLPEAAFPRTEAKSASGDAGLAHRQKLDCALQLARTVALDFNNALTIILGHTSLVLSQVEPNHPWRGSLLEIEKSAARAAEIANDLGAFSRQDKEVRSQTAGNLNLLAQRCVEVFQRDAGHEPGAWQLQLERRLFAAKFDEAKMQQAFMKIIENAVQALRSGGRVTVQTRNIELTEPPRTAMRAWQRGLMSASRSAITVAGSNRRCCLGSSSPFSRPSAAIIAAWGWPGCTASSPITAAVWPCPASRGWGPQCGFICPPKGGLSETTASRPMT